MEQEILFKDVLPYIEIWTFAIVFLISALTYSIWRIGKKHPEIFKPDTTAENKQTLLQREDLRRQYNNKCMLSVSFVFVWMIGIAAICLCFDKSELTTQGWFILLFAAVAILWIWSITNKQ